PTCARTSRRARFSWALQSCRSSCRRSPLPTNQCSKEYSKAFNCIGAQFRSRAGKLRWQKSSIGDNNRLDETIQRPRDVFKGDDVGERKRQLQLNLRHIPGMLGDETSV